MTDRKAKAAILKHLKGGKSTHVSDIIEGLEMEPEQAFRIVDLLLKEGAVDRTT